ncbi:SelR domain-containing protein [Phascolomyces articulosus]|uniref:Peptide-methionine (R)-S-oxide reductase n=1 Tax=Phascolomyces articulosus TaxID=60185 RepID=A0AAD5KKN0_9FUNG|nr:SelR domain-containing protein [Phascolomyces articulosus]
MFRKVIKTLSYSRTVISFRPAFSSHVQQRISLIARNLTYSSTHYNTMANKTEEEWRAILSPEQFRILREKGTEIAGTGEYNHHFEKGVYRCAGCNTPLYVSDTKFDSGCGWPAFFEAVPGAVGRRPDHSRGFERTEIVCNNCGGHLGHVFKGEGYKTPTDERHCVNSVSIKFGDK